MMLACCALLVVDFVFMLVDLLRLTILLCFVLADLFRLVFLLVGLVDDLFRLTRIPFLFSVCFFANWL